MRRAVMHADGLRLEETRLREPGGGEARVRAVAAGVAFGDLVWMDRKVPFGPRPPYTPGYDAAGVVDAVGARTRGLAEGDTVAGLLGLGAWSESPVAKGWRLVAVPEGLDMETAAAMPLNHVSAWICLGPLGRVGEGGRVLVHGAAGGLGTALLDLARHRGLEAWGTASEKQRGLVESYGATWLPHAGFRGGAAGAGGVDLVVDHVGGRHLRDSFGCLRPGGTVVAAGLHAVLRGREGWGRAVLGSLAAATRGVLPRRRLRLLDTPGWVRRHRRQYRDALASLMELAAAGRLRPRIDRVFPLDDVQGAVAHVRRGGVHGKVLLDMRD